MNFIRLHFKFLLIFLIILSLFSCNKKNLLNQLSIGCSGSEGHSLIFIAEKKGFFKKNGINVEVKKYDTGLNALEDMLNNKLDIAATTDPAFVTKSFDSPDLKILAVTVIANSHKILVHSDSGIINPSDLIGKKIGIAKGTSAEFAFYNYLTLININYNQVKIIDLQPNEYLNAFNKNEIDAVMTWEPNIYNLKKELKDKVFELSQKNIPFFYYLLCTKDEVIKKKYIEIQAMVKALKDAEDYVKKNNDASKILVKERMNTNDEYINYAWKSISISLSLPQDLIFAMESEAKWRINNNMTKNKTLPNFLKYIYFDTLEKIKPDSITIIK
jgi:ABC-type nitrate/sulfonate/bicarbonate transport system substrate-binding protein